VFSGDALQGSSPLTSGGTTSLPIHSRRPEHRPPTALPVPSSHLYQPFNRLNGPQKTIRQPATMASNLQSVADATPTTERTPLLSGPTSPTTSPTLRPGSDVSSAASRDLDGSEADTATAGLHDGPNHSVGPLRAVGVTLSLWLFIFTQGQSNHPCCRHHSLASDPLLSKSKVNLLTIACKP
jgi:hypothetical protein